MSITLVKPKKHFSDRSDCERQIMQDGKRIGELFRDNHKMSWRITINGKYVTYRGCDVFTLSTAKQAIVSYLQAGNT